MASLQLPVQQLVVISAEYFFTGEIYSYQLKDICSRKGIKSFFGADNILKNRIHKMCGVTA